MDSHRPALDGLRVAWGSCARAGKSHGWSDRPCRCTRRSLQYHLAGTLRPSCHKSKPLQSRFRFRVSFVPSCVRIVYSAAPDAWLLVFDFDDGRSRTLSSGSFQCNLGFASTLLALGEFTRFVDYWTRCHVRLFSCRSFSNPNSRIRVARVDFKETHSHRSCLTLFAVHATADAIRNSNSSLPF